MKLTKQNLIIWNKIYGSEVWAALDAKNFQSLQELAMDTGLSESAVSFELMQFEAIKIVERVKMEGRYHYRQRLSDAQKITNKIQAVAKGFGWKESDSEVSARLLKIARIASNEKHANAWARLDGKTSISSIGFEFLIAQPNLSILIRNMMALGMVKKNESGKYVRIPKSIEFLNQ